MKAENTMLRDIEEKGRSKSWQEYLSLMEERPELFRQNDGLRIITALADICAYERRTGQIIGVRYRSPYYMLVQDLVQNAQGEVFFYDRLLPAVPAGAVAMLPVYQGKYVLLHQFRHAIRDYQYGFPRGFGEPGLSPEENAQKELREELGGRAARIELLGTIYPDSGLTSTGVSVYRCDMESVSLQADHEQIENIVFLSSDELQQWVRDGKITDSFTLAAILLLKAKETKL
ncbi:MAG: NUDIX hydrolase [Oscillospiraceae bacterium]|nr:NUDIX hydrolase [Oscillospiraceae bacterium]